MTGPHNQNVGTTPNIKQDTHTHTHTHIR